ncbi:DNA polymerase Y family protein [Aliigemmobacter aestuarii]|uniref:DNA-directed DNA polymerase n=1 Tax=Aliigemmobacter aestuarii TaxID=1445661 RepID=A0A4S3MML4_9RHOB|nr:DNA polymerase Y family protein [Gemmobacter aestuarii]THD83549.1 DNA polymerase Y family protein [Gemmobacter aestuarii]
MAGRRILSLWFPRLAAERWLRLLRLALPQPFAVVADRNGAQVLTSLSPEAEAAGLRPGQPLRDATAMCPGLLTRPADPVAEARFLDTLTRWAGKFSPWVAQEAPDGLVIDLTGCAHLFGGEAGLLAQVEADCADLGLTMRAGVADTRGAAWALARFAGQRPAHDRSGDAIEQEARATRSRAATRRRGWERGGTLPPARPVDGPPQGLIAAPGQMRQALAALPLAALRLPGDVVEGLGRLGLRRVADIMGLPRAALARRFGTDTLARLDQALGLMPEPVNPGMAPPQFALRLTLPDPIGLRADVEAAMDRLLPELCLRLRRQGRGARRVRLEGWRSDGGTAAVEVGLARATDTPDRIRPLLALKLDAMEAGFGFDVIRVVATETEPLNPQQHRGHLEARDAAEARGQADTALEDLVGKLGARLGMENVLRFHPAESNIPEKTATVHAAAWSEPCPDPWPRPPTPRPLILFRPEPVDAPEDPVPPARFRWRRRDLSLRQAIGPERIAPEWWLDDPEWRSGPRDYWRVLTREGDRLWLFYAHGGAIGGGWFCHGSFT